MPPPAASEECQFYYKVGACRHGNKCVRKHTPPLESKSVILVNLEAFVASLFVEIGLIAPIEEMLLASNDSPHLAGNVYVSLASTDDARSVLTNLNARWFDKRPIFATYLPAPNLSLAVCREGASCPRKFDCNYVHPIELSDSLWTKLFTAQTKEIMAARAVKEPNGGSKCNDPSTFSAEPTW